MKKMLLALIVLSSAGWTWSMTTDEAKAFLDAAKSRFLSAKTYRMEYEKTVMGVTAKSVCMISRDAKKGMSLRDDSQVQLMGIALPTLTQLLTGGKAYTLTSLLPKTALHMKFADMQAGADVFCNFFTDEGVVEPVSDTSDKCVIRFTPSSRELAQMRKRAATIGQSANVPTAFQYAFRKPSKDLVEIVGFDERGNAFLKLVVSSLELNAEIDDSVFALPKDCKVIDLETAAEAAKALSGYLPRFGTGATPR